MKFKKFRLFIVAIIAGMSLSIAAAAPAVAAPAVVFPQYTKESCYREMMLGAKRCSRLKPAKAAAICHGVNMARYGACLAWAD